jgi:hypothetical protein
MLLQDFIQREVFEPKVKQRGVLVIYDPQQRYKDVCAALARNGRAVVDASESSIESRAHALAALQRLGAQDGALDSLVVYVPAQPPRNDEEKQADPFAIYGVIGATFPAGDGDEYQSICLRAKPDHSTKVRQVFRENPNPNFDVINAIGGGSSWPQLQSILGAESARDLLFALLAPSDDAKKKLKDTDSWVTEARELLQGCIGLKLVTRGKTWNSIADELWRYVLFSEFVFDLPETLPEPLVQVPKADQEARPVVEDLCDRLRNDRRTQNVYIERAEAIESELNLRAICAEIHDLGIKDTFPFEERSICARAVKTLAGDDMDALRKILGRQSMSVWGGRGESQAQWQLLQSATSLIEACDDASRALPDHSQTQQSLIDFYIANLREVDRLHREFEQAVSDSLFIIGESLNEVTQAGRAAYVKFIDQVHDLFIRHLEKSGWPPAGMLANADVFDAIVGPKLAESGRRVGYILVDALRYELGVALEQQLREDGKVELQAAFAQLPSVTPIGMASLLPGASTQLKLRRKGDGFVPVLADIELKNVQNRMRALSDRFGERFAEMKIEEFVRTKTKPAQSVELFVIRTNNIDSTMETSPDAALDGIGKQLKLLRVAVHKLREFGFDDAVIVTDHGFFMNAHADVGDVGIKPPGNWIALHDRSLLGDGQADVKNIVLSASLVGIQGDFAQFGCPRGLVAYSANVPYFHGGASLQECVVPVISIQLNAALEKKAKVKTTVSISYKSSKITTRLPVLELAFGTGAMFDFMYSSIEVLLEASDKDGKVVGEAKPGGPVNPATGTIGLSTSKPERVTLKMDTDFEGKFTVKVLDPVTMTVYGKLNLETDYTV